MQRLQPCAYCEEELPASHFDSPDAPFCKSCSQAIGELIRKKYGIIEAAHFRAQLRHKTRHLFDQHKEKA